VKRIDQAKNAFRNPGITDAVLPNFFKHSATTSSEVDQPANGLFQTSATS
jgi:hypothetical protein